MGRNNSKPERERRRLEAEARQAEYNKLDLDMRQHSALARPGNAFRERTRLMAERYGAAPSR